MQAQSLSHVWLFETPWTIAYPGSSVPGIFRQEYWSGLLFPPQGDLPNPGSKPTSLASRLAGRFFTTEPPGKPKFLLESLTTQAAGGGQGGVGVIREGICIIPS